MIMSGQEPNTVTQEMVNILGDIRAEAKGTNARLDIIDGEMKGMRADIGGLRREMQQGLADVNARLDTLHDDVAAVGATTTKIKNELSGLRAEVAADLRQLKERVEKLEAAVFPKPTRPTRRPAPRR
jgi:hypothetical protein